MQNLHDFNTYYMHVTSSLIREPIYKIDLLHKEDDSLIGSITQAIEDGSGSISVSNQDGARRSASFTLNNYQNQWKDYFKYLSIGQRLKIKTNNNNYITYKVVSGDSLYSIAKKYNTTVNNIKELNNLTTNLLSINQMLKIPTK